MGGVFISYRRDDSRGSAGRLYDDLRDKLGQGVVFRDIDAIEAGVDYLAEIVRTIGECDAMVAVIGREWLESKDKAGKRRLDDPGDLVRQEIAAALERGKVVIPVLLEDAVMPSEADLPAPLLLLASRNALPISDLRWDYDIGRLAVRLQQLLQSPPKPPPPSGRGESPGRPAGTRRDSARLLLCGLVAGVVVLLLFQTLVLKDRTNNSGKADSAGSAPSTGPSGTAAAPTAVTVASGLKPWADSEAVVTSRDGSVTVVEAATLQAGGSGSQLQLESGQQIPFEKMRSLEVVAVLADSSTALSRVEGVITLLDGTATNAKIRGFTDLYGSNSLGKFSLDGAQVKHVDFRR